MNTEVALILTVGGIVGSLLVTQVWQMNYFRKEQFKFKLWQTKKLDSLNLKKLQKDMGLDKKPVQKGLEGIDVKGLIDQYLGGNDDDESEENWITEAIGQIAQNNPELVQKVIGGIANKTGNDTPEHMRGVNFEE